jgi:hypothetical protein
VRIGGEGGWVINTPVTFTSGRNDNVQKIVTQPSVSLLVNQDRGTG